MGLQAYLIVSAILFGIGMTDYMSRGWVPGTLR